MSFRRVSTKRLDSKENRNSLKYGQQHVSINMANLNPNGNRNSRTKSSPNSSPEDSQNCHFKKRTISFEYEKKFQEQKGNVTELIQSFMFNEYRKDQKTVISTFGRLDDRGIYRVYRESFQDLFNIIDNSKDRKHHQICVKMIYYFLDEFRELGSEIDNSDIQNLVERVTKMINTECRTQILKVFVAFLKNSKDGTYTKLKEDVLRCVLHDSKHPSACEMSYKTMMNHCDQYFFKLAFLLKENFIIEFKVEYKKLLKSCQNHFGEYWTYAIKQNAQLLYLMADALNLVDTREFMLLNTVGSELKSKITSTFEKLAEFQAVYKPLSGSDEILMKRFNEIVDANLLKTLTYDGITKEYVNIDEFMQMFINVPRIRKLLFGRKDLQSASLFEKILSSCMLNDGKWDAKFGGIISYIWHEFCLWEIPEIYVMETPLNKLLMEYVLETDNDAYFISFLMLDVPKEYDHIHQPLHYMMLKNSLFCDYKIKKHMAVSSENETNERNVKCLIEYHLNLINKNTKDDYENTHNLLYLFEEMSQYRPEAIGENQFFVDLFDKILSEKPEKFDGKHELKLPRKHFWIGLMMIYWNYFVEFEPISTDGQSSESQKYSIILRSVSSPNKVVLKLEGFYIPFLSILSLVIVKKEDKFMDEFPKEIMNMEKSYRQIYELENNYDARHQTEDENEIFNFYEKYSSIFSFILLYAAIKTNQKRIVEKVFEFNNFLINIPEFPANMKVEDIHHHTILMFLENKYELDRGDLPKNWIPQKVMKKFLDSRITSLDNHYKIDCQFMLPYYNHDVKPEAIVDDAEMMNEDYDTLKYILEDNNLSPLITHPVMEMIIKTKLRKYDRILFWNFFLFVVTYLLPTIALVYLFHRNDDFSDAEQPVVNPNSTTESFQDDENITAAFNSSAAEDQSNNKSNLGKHWIFILIFIRLVFLVPREVIQCFYDDKSFVKYFKKISNCIESGLIVLPFILLVLALKYGIDRESNQFLFVVVVEALNVLLMIIATVSLYPAIKFSIYMKCLQTVFSTYLMTFFLFLPLFFGFVAMAFILFDKHLGGKIEDFHDLGDASTKYIIMYSGEIAIDPKSISGVIQIIAITVMIIFIINKANLILSIVVNDVQKVMDQSKQFTMRLYAKKYVKFAEKIRTFYACHVEPRENDLKLSTKIMFYFVKLATRKYPEIHQLHTLYVEKKTGNVYVEDGTPLFYPTILCPDSFRKSDWWIVKKYSECWDNFFSNLTLDAETMEVIKEIDESRYESRIETDEDKDLISRRVVGLLNNFDGQISKDINDMKWMVHEDKLTITLPLNKDSNNWIF